MPIDFTKFNKMTNEFKEYLDINCDSISELEEALTKAAINIPFTLHTEQDTCLLWNICQVCKRFRFLYGERDDAGDLICKPLLECKIEVRLKMVRYLQSFIDEFAKFIDESYSPTIKLRDHHIKI